MFVCFVLTYFKISNCQHFIFQQYNVSTFQNCKLSIFKCSKCCVFADRLPFCSTEKRKVAANTISYKRYREIIFQNVALCYLLHFVQDGSSKKNTIKLVFAQKYKTHEHWEKKQRIYFPPNSRSTAPLRRLFMLPGPYPDSMCQVLVPSRPGMEHSVRGSPSLRQWLSERGVPLSVAGGTKWGRDNFWGSAHANKQT